MRQRYALVKRQAGDEMKTLCSPQAWVACLLAIIMSAGQVCACLDQGPPVGNAHTRSQDLGHGDHAYIQGPGHVHGHGQEPGHEHGLDDGDQNLPCHGNQPCIHCDQGAFLATVVIDGAALASAAAAPESGGLWIGSVPARDTGTAPPAHLESLGWRDPPPITPVVQKIRLQN